MTAESDGALWAPYFAKAQGPFHPSRGFGHQAQNTTQPGGMRLIITGDVFKKRRYADTKNLGQRKQGLRSNASIAQFHIDQRGRGHADRSAQYSDVEIPLATNPADILADQGIHRAASTGRNIRLITHRSIPSDLEVSSTLGSTTKIAPIRA